MTCFCQRPTALQARIAGLPTTFSLAWKVVWQTSEFSRSVENPRVFVLLGRTVLAKSTSGLPQGALGTVRQFSESSVQGTMRPRRLSGVSGECRINECRFTSSSGRRIESLTLRVTPFNQEKSKKFVLAKHWFSAQSLTEGTLSTTYWGEPHPGGISSALSFNFPMPKASLLRPDR